MQVVDGGAKGATCGGEREEDNGVACAIEGYTGYVCTATAVSPWSYSMSTYIPGVASVSTLGFFGEDAAVKPRCLTPCLSPWYEDALAHDGFNPNTMFSLTYDEQHRQQGHGVDGVAFIGRTVRSRSPKWKVLEDQCLCDTWVTGEPRLGHRRQSKVRKVLGEDQCRVRRAPVPRQGLPNDCNEDKPKDNVDILGHHPGIGELVPWTPFRAREQRG
jgi:hypothetical protein